MNHKYLHDEQFCLLSQTKKFQDPKLSKKYSSKFTFLLITWAFLLQRSYGPKLCIWGFLFFFFLGLLYLRWDGRWFHIAVWQNREWCRTRWISWNLICITTVLIETWKSNLKFKNYIIYFKLKKCFANIFCCALLIYARLLVNKI